MTKQLSKKAQTLSNFITERHGAKVRKHLLEGEVINKYIPAAGGGFLVLTDQRVLYQTQFHEAEKEPNVIERNTINSVEVFSSLLGGTKLSFDTTNGPAIVKVVNKELAEYVKENI